MALKRHEVPPPGYFNRLPGTIIDRIEMGEGRLNVWERLHAAFTIRPAFAYAFVLAACGTLTATVYSVKMKTAEEAYQRPSKNSLQSESMGGSFANNFNPALGPHVANWIANTNPSMVSTSMPSLFDIPYQAVPVSYDHQ
jgi:hypothetical protein